MRKVIATSAFLITMAAVAAAQIADGVEVRIAKRAVAGVVSEDEEPEEEPDEQPEEEPPATLPPDSD